MIAWSWPSFSALGAAWAFLLIVPLVVLYFLKLRRPQVVVPSLVLWQRLLLDKRVNSPFQRFRNNLLLWLQLLLLCLLILAAMMPFFRGTAGGSRMLVLLDCSASMAGRLAPDAKTSMELCKERIEEVIAALGGGRQLGIVTFGSSARLACPFTDSPRRLRDALAEIQVQEVGSNPLEALRMADALARQAKVEAVILYSDGNLPATVDFALPFELQFETVPAATSNLGITSLHARRSGEGRWGLFVQVQGSPGTDLPADLVLKQDGVEQHRESVHLREGFGQRFVFGIDVQGQSSLELVLEAQGFDALASDDRAFLELSEARPLRVLMSPGLPNLRDGLQALAEVEIDAEPRAGREYDLVVGQVGEVAQAAPTRLLVDGVPPQLGSLLEIKRSPEGPDTVVDWRRASGLLEHMEMGELRFAEACNWVGEAGEADLEIRRFEVLAFGRKGPLILQREEAGELDFYLLFHPQRSTLPYRLAFPIFCRNLSQIALQRVGLLEVRANQTGVLPELRLQAQQTYSIRSPSGRQRQEVADPRGSLRGVAAGETGVYRIEGPGAERLQVGLSLLDPEETGLLTVKRLGLREKLEVDAAATVETDRFLWPWLVALGLLICLIEWWVFSARPGGYVTREVEQVRG